LSEYSIAERLNESDMARFAFDNLLASPGAIVAANGKCFSIPTLVPARGMDGACRFLQNDRCAIHAEAPFGCSHFSTEQSKEESDAISAHGLMEIAKAWRRGDLYARLWPSFTTFRLIGISHLQSLWRPFWHALQ